jgi:hypothetical protein
MENIIETIRAAIASDASPEARAAGAAACRAILTALESTPGQPIGAAIVAPPASPVAAIVATLRGVPTDQLLDLAIMKLRAALPAGVEVPQAAPLKLQFIPKAQLEALARSK